MGEATLTLVDGRASRLADPRADDQAILADALIATRRAANCESLPGFGRRALEASCELLELYVEKAAS